MDAKRNPDPYEVHDGPVSAYKAGEAVGEGNRRGQPGRRCGSRYRRQRTSTMPASEKPERAKELEEKNAAILRGKDASMSWGGGGATETFRERGAESIPLARWLRWALLHSRAARPVRSRLSLAARSSGRRSLCGHMERERHFCKHANRRLEPLIQSQRLKMRCS